MRRSGLFAAFVLLLIMAVDGGAWVWATGRIVAGLPDFVRDASGDGWLVEWKAARRTGWPTRATVELMEVSATRPLGGTVLRWQAPRVLVSVRPLDPRALQIEATGEQAVEFAGGIARLNAATETLRVPLDGVGPIRLQAQTAVLALPNGASATVGTTDAQFDAAATAAKLSAVALAPPLAAPFNGTADLAVRAVIAPPLPFAPTPAQSATLWRQADGKLMVDSLDVRWGPARVQGQGEFGLDAGLQPAGRLGFEVEGAPALLDGLGRAGLVAPGPFSAVRAVVSLLSLGAGGGPIRLPVLLRDRTVVVAQFPVLRLPELVWDVR